MKHAALFGLLAGLALTPAVHAAAADHVHATHAWIRVLPGSLPAGGYVTLENDGDQPVALTGASSTAYAQVMLHHSSTQGGVSRMTMVDALPVPAHGKAVLAPAAYHFMLMQPAAPVKPGTTVRLQLKFSDGSSLPADFIARPANALDDGTDQAGRDQASHPASRRSSDGVSVGHATRDGGRWPHWRSTRQAPIA